MQWYVTSLPQHRTAPHLTTTTTTTTAAAADNIFPDNLGSGLGWAGGGCWAGLGWAAAHRHQSPSPGTSCRGITRAGVTRGCGEAPLVTRLTIHTVQPSPDTLGVITVSLRARYVRARSRLTVKCAGCRVRPAPRAAARHCRQVKVAGRPQSRLGTAASTQPTAYLHI